MPDDNWERVQEIFLEAADLPEADRARFLDSACIGDRALRREVESLLQADTEGVALVDEAIETEAASMLEEPSFVGARLGPYRVVQEIGRGGMGAVFLAERDDDQFQKLVAIKVVKHGMDTREVLGRFRHERQILAGLEHPYIARLLDGGTTPDGRPFFVMERVEGQPIDQYCREHTLDLEAILRLFLRVCEAVSHAHRALVVHRDLKPGNILVNPDGVPKLLDFGVAKLLGPESDPGLTSTAYGVGPLTPDYASPEQVRGLPVTTATDVYALGAILFELLTGTRAQKISTHTPQEIDRVVCETQPPRPSVVARAGGLRRRLSSDLDNIVAMAMRKERERRYSSVGQLAGDIRRYLEGRPVKAQQDSFGYRAGKFMRRNRLPIAAAALVFGSLLAGVGASVHQARQAEAARRVAEGQRQAAERASTRAAQEAQTARTEQDRSARRLTQMVELADRSLYDVHSAIEKLPGAMEARRQIVATTLQFLENLSKDSGQDDRLFFVLSAAYLKVGDMQGHPQRPNIGDSTGALASYQKSLDLIEPLVAKESRNPEYLLRRIEAETNRAWVLARTGQQARAVPILHRLLPMAQEIARLCPNDSRCLLTVPGVCLVLADTLETTDSHTALEYAHRQTKSLERALRSFPHNTGIQKDLAGAYSLEAARLNRRGELRDAAERYQRAIALGERLLRSDPSDVHMRRSLMISYGNLGGNLGSPLYLNLGDIAGAQQSYGKALAIARELAAADANDKLAQSDLAQALFFYASLELPEAQWPRSLALLREAEGKLQTLIAADPQSISRLIPLAMVLEYEGRRLQSMGQGAAALAQFRQSLAAAEKVLGRNSSSFSALSQALADEEAIAELLARQGDGTLALEMARKAVARAEHVSAPESERDRVSRYIATAYRSLASVQASLGNWSETRISAGRAATEWRRLIAAGSRYVDRVEADRAEALLRESATHLQ